MSGVEPPVYSPDKKRVGRPNDPIWEHFEKKPKPSVTQKFPGQCRHCLIVVQDGRPENLYKHMVDCPASTPEVKAQCAEWQAIKAAMQPRKKRKLDKASDTLGSDSKAPQKVLKQSSPPHLQPNVVTMGHRPASVHMAIHLSLLKMLIMSGTSFSLVDDPYFKDFVKTLCPTYIPPGRTMLLGSVLQQEFAGVKLAILQKVEHARDLTLGTQSWTDSEGRYLYGTSVTFNDRSVELLDISDLASGLHMGNHIAEHLIQIIHDRIVDPLKVAFICTDNTPDLVFARRKVTTTPGLEHIVGVRCMMQAFGLMMVAIVAHPWAMTVIVKAQRLVSFFLDSAQPMNELRRFADAQGISTSLSSCRKTHLTSLHTCAGSVLALKDPLLDLVRWEEGRHMLPPWMVEEIEDSNGEFWAQLEVFWALSAPYSDLTAALQAGPVTLADFTRYWISLARQLLLLSQYTFAAAGYKSHCFASFNKRYIEIDRSLCRLALFLDPRYKDTIVSPNNVTFRNLLQEGLTLMNKRRYTKEEALSFRNQLLAYNGGSSPYDAFAGGPSFDVKSWWLMIQAPSTLEICAVATLLCDLVPYAFAAERSFVTHSGFYSDEKNSLNTSMLCMIGAIKTHYATEAARSGKVVKKREAEDVLGPGTGETGLAAPDCRAAEAGEPEPGVSEDGDLFTPEGLESTLDALFRAVQAERPPIDSESGVEVAPHSISCTDLLISADFDLGSIKFSPQYVGDVAIHRPEAPRMGTTPGGFDVNDIMGLDRNAAL
eukprot:jgi/Botrbrau1/15473/Bobra.43_2s0094.2